jgi:hypothetical protein
VCGNLQISQRQSRNQNLVIRGGDLVAIDAPTDFGPVQCGWSSCGALAVRDARNGRSVLSEPRALDLHLEIEDLIVAGDTVVLRVAFRGTDTGGNFGRAPTGRAVEEWAVTIMHFEGDKVPREWIGADKLGLFIQLGVLDDP